MADSEIETEIIPAGYELRFTSWENDGDHYQTKTLRGLGFAEAAFLVDLASRFGDDWSEEPTEFGNCEIGSERLRALVESVLLRHPDLPPERRALWSGDDLYSRLCEKILGYPAEYDWGFCRHIESIDAFEIPAPVRIERRGAFSAFFSADGSPKLPEPPAAPSRKPLSL